MIMIGTLAIILPSGMRGAPIARRKFRPVGRAAASEIQIDADTACRSRLLFSLSSIRTGCSVPSVAMARPTVMLSTGMAPATLAHTSRASPALRRQVNQIPHRSLAVRRSASTPILPKSRRRRTAASDERHGDRPMPQRRGHRIGFKLSSASIAGPFALQPRTAEGRRRRGLGTHPANSSESPMKIHVISIALGLALATTFSAGA